MKGTLKDKFNQIKTKVKNAAHKVSDADKSKIKTLKENFRKKGKV